MVLKFHNEIITIDSWRPDETYDGVFPKGAREKRVDFSPDNPQPACIKAGWRYLFKLARSRNWCPWQFWVEIVAYRLGCLINVPVPPAYVGLNRKYQTGEDTYGALIEWFYDERKDMYIEGGQFMGQLIKNYDRKKGIQHNWELLSRLKDFIPDTIEYWAGVFTLDSLIGNTDRHQDNWGWILKGAKQNPEDYKLSYSPAFDNGTALGYEIREKDFVKYQDGNRLNRYLTHPQRARHHMKWSLNEREPINFYEFVRKFVVQFPKAKPIMERHLSFSREQAKETLVPLPEMVADKRCRLTRKRLDFMLDLIFKRKKLLGETLEQCGS